MSTDTPFTFATWNLRDYGKHDTPEERVRAEVTARVIASLDADVIAVQEVCDPDGYEELAEKAGMQCRVPTTGTDTGDMLALDPGRRRMGMGLMWKPGVKPIVDSLRTYPLADLYHGLVRMDVSLGGQRVTVASTHLTPWGPYRRYDEACTLAGILRGFPHVLVGADWNSVSAARTAEDNEYYDPDPFAGKAWEARFLDKCQVDDREDADDRDRFWADRRPMYALELGGLYDVTAVLNGPWHATVGHWYEGAIAKRIDGGRSTDSVAVAAIDVTVVKNRLTCSISDHLPVRYTFDPARIRARTDARVE